MAKYDVLKESAKVLGSSDETADTYGFLKVEAKVMVEFQIEEGRCLDCGWEVEDMKDKPIEHFNHCFKSTRLV